ncbi:hypothetical protein [Streptomyces kaempferi]|uniref:Uncharacterized protein n=1 Tax=Streptomyces kaempferi TaxID=333725 RepID=A0ABW3XSS3_9ACTN
MFGSAQRGDRERDPAARPGYAHSMGIRLVDQHALAAGAGRTGPAPGTL